MELTSTAVEFETAAWGPASIADADLDLLAEVTGIGRDECLERLRDYDIAEMASAWRGRDPRTPEEIRTFYTETDLYLWELLAWNGSSAYEPYRRRLDLLAELWPPRENPRALDYGCGVGTAALRLAELGYRITIADVPSRTLDFARARLERRGFGVNVIEIPEDVPQLAQKAWDVLVCFDVLEHVADPRNVAKALVCALTLGGGAAVVASFGGEDVHPQHLPEGVARFRGHRFNPYFQTLGVQHLGDDIFRRVGRGGAAVRRLRYAVWRATGLYIERLKR